MGRVNANANAIIILVFILLQFKVHADDLYGIFMIVKGKVEIVSSKTGRGSVKVGSKAYPGDKIVCDKDSRAKLVMSDRNVMNISPETEIVIAKYENDAKTGQKNVELELSQGKVRNNVEQKYDGEKSKFLIKTPTAVAGVRGTQFLTSFNPATRVTEIVTFKGAVQMSALLAGGKVSPNAVVIKKGETSSLKSGQEKPEPPRTLPKEELSKEDKGSQAKNNKENSDIKGNGETTNQANESNNQGNNDKREPASEKKESTSDTTSNKRDPANEPKKPEQRSMVNSSDLDGDKIVKEIPPPIVAGPSFPVLPDRPRIPDVIQPRTNIPNIDDIIRGKVNKTTVIVIPVPPKTQ